MLLDDGALVAQGTASDVITQRRIESVYRWPVQVTVLEESGGVAPSPQIIPLRKEES